MARVKNEERHRPLYLREVLDALGVSQNELARRLGCKHHTIVSAWCRGPYYPSWTRAIAIAEALRIPLDYLAGRVALRNVQVEAAVFGQAQQPGLSPAQ